MNEDYSDIIGLPHFSPKHHPRMSMEKRAAQFAPFAALTGYEETIEETGRTTDTIIELSQYNAEKLNTNLNKLIELLPQRPVAIITFFEPDKRKEGGKYNTISTIVKKYDEYNALLILDNNTEIPIKHILSLTIETNNQQQNKKTT